MAGGFVQACAGGETLGDEDGRLRVVARGWRADPAPQSLDATAAQEPFAAVGADELQAVQLSGQVAYRHEKQALPYPQVEGLHALAG